MTCSGESDITEVLRLSSILALVRVEFLNRGIQKVNLKPLASHLQYCP